MIQYAFMGIGFLVTLLNVLTFLALRRRVLTAFPKRGGLIAWLLAVPFFIMLHAGILLMFGGITGLMVVRSEVPEWFAIAGMSFQMGVWLYGGWLLLVGTPAALISAVRRYRRLFVKKPEGTEPEKELAIDERRRNLVKAGLVLPVAMVATTAGGAMAARQEPSITRLRLAVPRDRTNLHGLTIAQVSDVHVGSYMDGARLDMIRDTMNALKVDIHVCTGDLLDNHPDQLEESTRFLRGLQPRVGRFMCMGNHEYISGREGGMDEILAGLRDTGVQLLIDDAQKIQIGGDHLWMLGIDYPGEGGSHSVYNRMTERTTDESLDVALAQTRDDGAPRILLSHHPKTFHQASERPIDLTLSGHTHGGQLSLGRIGDFELTPVLPFEFFHNGHYARNGGRLYVNAGAGGWMPVRINCPPEITVIELVSA